MALDFLKNKSPIVSRAYEFANLAHADQLKNGEPYINHLLGTAESLHAWGLDDATIAAGLLHDVIEDAPVTLKEIEKEFGEEIKTLVDGATHIEAIKYDIEKAEAETLMKMFIAMTKDLRIVLIKLASRRENMKNIKKMKPEERLKMAKETIEIHAPLSYRLGMQGLSGELEDLSFPHLYPEEHQWLLENVKERYDEREKYLAKIKPIVEAALQEEGIKPISINLRAKRYSSLYKKLLRYEMDLDKIYDLIAFRIIVSDIRDCYSVPGVIHKLWPPLPGRIKDYIALPKPNGYQSIHTTVLCDDQKIVEFQVKTKEMHEKAENGIAAHWAYEKTKGNKAYLKRNSSFAKKDDILLINQLRNWQNGLHDTNELIESLKVDFFSDRIFAITPKGEVIDLPQGSTPIDFAYAIHEGLGNECVGAKVNGKIVPLDYKLHSEDVIEIIRQKHKKPSPSWLDFTVTSNAKDHIKHSLRGVTSLLTKSNALKTEFKVTIEDKPGLLKAVSDAITRSHISIVGINSSENSEKFHTLRIKCDLSDKTKISKMMMKIKSIKGVRAIDYRFV